MCNLTVCNLELTIGMFKNPFEQYHFAIYD